MGGGRHVGFGERCDGEVAAADCAGAFENRVEMGAGCGGRVVPGGSG